MGSSSSNTIPRLILVLSFVAIALAQQATPASGGIAGTPSANQVPAGTPNPVPLQSESVEGTAAVLKVKTRLVVVDVIALDHKGNSVADL
ncbi:MAG: hypothetical protein JWM08_829, partial [Candidatus Angelobacter sp.]|nr:hypothetical protein [Candidatus Angelobacter sp.]